MNRGQGDDHSVRGSDEPPIYVEVDTAATVPLAQSDWDDDEVREGRARRVVESAQDLVGDAVTLARTCAARFSAGLRELPGHVPAPAEIELELGITLDAECGAVLAKAKTSAQLQLRMTWKNGETG